MDLSNTDIESGEEEEGNRSQKEQEEELQKMKKKQVGLYCSYIVTAIIDDTKIEYSRDCGWPRRP